MLGLMLIYRAMLPKAPQDGSPNLNAAAQTSLTTPVSQEPAKPSALAQIGPFLVLSGLWILIVTTLIPLRLKYLYRKDPRMQGLFTVSITPTAVSTDNSAGTSARSSWNVYEYWCEGKSVIVLKFFAGSYAILSLAGLSLEQRGELHGILGSALKKR